jgi:hypothetical protein
MSGIEYLTENRARDLLLSEIDTHKDKRFVLGAEGFTKHHIDVGNTAFYAANKILEKHPSLAAMINPELLRAEGYVHDFGKIFETDPLHEVPTACEILLNGDGNLGLVRGGSIGERKTLLRIMASCAMADSPLYEELGGADFPEACLYEDHIDRVRDRVEYLRKELSTTGKPLSMEELTLPLSLNQQIALFADLTLVDGKIGRMQERLDEITVRYNTKGQYHNPTGAELAQTVKKRGLPIESLILSLMGEEAVKDFSL